MRMGKDLAGPFPSSPACPSNDSLLHRNQNIWLALGVDGNCHTGTDTPCSSSSRSSRRSIIENDEESTDSLKNSTSSVSGQGNGSVQKPPKGIMADRRIGVVCSRAGIVENDEESTDSLKNPIGSVSGQGNNFVWNPPYGVIGDRRIGVKGSVQIPTVETDMNFSFLSNSIGWNAGHGNGSVQNPSGAVSSSQLETVDTEGRGIGSVIKIKYLPLLDSTNLQGPCSSVVGRTPFFNGQNRSTVRAGCCSSTEIARNPIAEGHLEASSNMLFQSHFRLAFPDPFSWERLQDNEILWMARNRMGCKHLLEILEQEEATQKILGATLGSMVELMAHESGNRLFQKLLQSCNEDQISEVVLSVTAQDGALINAAKRRYGNLSVQSLISKVKQSSLLITSVTSALAPGIVSLMIHPFGCHVIQHWLINLYDHQNMFTHKSGCISLQTCLNHWLLLKKIVELSVLLSQDPFGNYVVGGALKLEIPEVIHDICHQLKGHYVDLSMKKFSSFIVQKCIALQTEFVVSELLASGKLVQLACDRYGNFVIQTALKRTEDVLKLRMIDVFRPHSQSLRFHLYGHNVFHLISGS